MNALQFIIQKQRWESHAGCIQDSDAAQLIRINVNRTISFYLCFGISLGS